MKDNGVSPLRTYMTFRHGHMFCGLGGGAKGFNRGRANVGNVHARWECAGGIDVDPAAVRDFERLTGARGTVLDLFDREQYVAFHGKQPPKGWKPAGSADILAALGPLLDALFLSPPCKGLSGLLSENKSRSAKYQALNRLTVRGVWLALEAYKDNPIPLILLENVPRIASRGRHLLDEITMLLHAYGYKVAETTHDCGELGGLAQSRKRFLMVARHTEKVPSLLYEPYKRPLKAVGDILSRMPPPGDPAAGPMHRIPALQWKTWVRLAFVEAGSDWRSLKKLAVENGYLRDYGIVPDMGPWPKRWYDDVLGVLPYSGTMGTITAKSSPTTGRFAVADPTPGATYSGKYSVSRYDERTGTVLSNSNSAQGAYAVADPTPGDAGFSKYAVTPYDSPAGTVISGSTTGQGAFAVADVVPECDLRRTALGVTVYGEPSYTVTGRGLPYNGKFGVADPNLASEHHKNVFRIISYNENAGTVTSGHSPSNGAGAVADPNCHGMRHNNVFRIVRFADPSCAVTAGTGPSSGGQAVSDPNTGYGCFAHHNLFKVTAYDGQIGAVTGAAHITGAAPSVADPNTGWTRQACGHSREGAYGVAPWTAHAAPVTASGSYDNGPNSVADPMPGLSRDKGDNYLTAGQYGVRRYDEPGGAVSASACHDNGYFSVADRDLRLPDLTSQLVCMIIARDGTWHRPFTTLELAALQSLIDPEEYLELEGLSDSAWRERIGNAVPPKAAEGIAHVMGEVLLLTRLGETFTMSAQPIWVKPITAALMAATGGM